MKVCSVCALELEDSYLFCPDDGSSLAATASDPSSARLLSSNPDDDTASVVLYCPACGAEYPLTFSSCPVHGVQLTRQSMQSVGKQAVSESSETPINSAALVSGQHIDSEPPVTPNEATSNLHPNVDIASGIAADAANSTGAELIENRESDTEPSAAATPATGTQPRPVFPSEPHEPEGQGFRIAAIATMIALAIFALVGLYALASNLSRRPSPAARTASQTEPAQAVPFVVTPQAALDYKEEQPAAPAAEKLAEPPTTTRIVERQRKEKPSSSNEERKSTIARSITRLPAQSPSVSTAAMQASDPPALLAHANSGEFDSRLVRARARRTSAGYRYDLTFNMQEQRGHSAQWQRVLITTRSASGASHTQAIPFVHRLGATGALTFTISVELTGRSEADWRGRINCTTLGWDNAGAPLQASFVANVTP
jgi:hypothetical protein